MTSLCERVDFIINEKKISRTQLARMLGKPQQTFNSYFHSPRGKALAALTGRLCELWPDVSRKWLETGEGDIYLTPVPTAEDYAALSAERDTLQAQLEDLQAENKRLRSELDSANCLNRELTIRLLDKTAR